MAALRCLQIAWVWKMGKGYTKDAKNLKQLARFTLSAAALILPLTRLHVTRQVDFISVYRYRFVLFCFCMVEFCPFLRCILCIFFQPLSSIVPYAFVPFYLPQSYFFQHSVSSALRRSGATAASECRYTFMRKGNWLHFCKYLSEG